MTRKKFPLPNVVLSEYFKLENIIDVYPYGNGHINHTYLVEFPTCKYIIQKINDVRYHDRTSSKWTITF